MRAELSKMDTEEVFFFFQSHLILQRGSLF